MTAPSDGFEPAEWLARAVRDLEKASAVSALDSFDPGDVCAYAQQAAEKAIKAVLAGEADAVPRMHDLAALRKRSATEIAPLVTDEMLVRTGALWISSRYPGDWLEPTPEDAAEALRVVRTVVSAVVRIMAEKENT